jgi:hypothetical protein
VLAADAAAAENERQAMAAKSTADVLAILRIITPSVMGWG